MFSPTHKNVTRIEVGDNTDLKHNKSGTEKTDQKEKDKTKGLKKINRVLVAMKCHTGQVNPDKKRNTALQYASRYPDEVKCVCTYEKRWCIIHGIAGRARVLIIVFDG